MVTLQYPQFTLIGALLTNPSAELLSHQHLLHRALVNGYLVVISQWSKLLVLASSLLGEYLLLLFCAF